MSKGKQGKQDTRNTDPHTHTVYSNTNIQDITHLSLSLSQSPSLPPSHTHTHTHTHGHTQPTYSQTGRGISDINRKGILNMVTED